MNTIINFLFAAIKAGVPFLYGTTGEIITQKSGSLNLGVEGMMYMGAFVGFYAGFKTGSLALSLVAAFLTGVAAAFVFAFLTVTLQANQNVTGLTLTIFGGGFSVFFGEVMIANTTGGTPKLSEQLRNALVEINIPYLSDIPYIGKLLFSHNILVYLAILVAIVCWIYIRFTKMGLATRSVGENPSAADASGLNVTLIKYINIMLGGGICGLGGAYISLIDGGGVWNNGCVNGQGWISVALVIFAAWSPAKAIFGSLVFGMFTELQLRASDFATEFSFLAFFNKIPVAFYKMLPFIITALVLVFASVSKKREGNQPASCGINYYREER